MDTIRRSESRVSDEARSPDAVRSEATGEVRPAEDSAKRRQILDGARRIFVRTGFDAASMNDVTREAGVSKSTLYVYFRSKEELFQALISQERESYFAEVEPLFGDAEHPAETLQRYGEKLAGFTLSSGAMHAKRTVIAVASRMPELGRDFYRHGPERGHAVLCRYLERAVAAGALAIEDVPLAAAQFVELCTAGVLRRRFFDDEAPEPTPEAIERLVAAAVRLFLAGYGRRDSM